MPAGVEGGCGWRVGGCAERLRQNCGKDDWEQRGWFEHLQFIILAGSCVAEICGDGLLVLPRPLVGRSREEQRLFPAASRPALSATVGSDFQIRDEQEVDYIK